MIRVRISGHLSEYIGRKREFEIPDDVGTVLALVSYLDKSFPGIKDRILDNQERTREYVNIFLNGEDLRESNTKEDTKLKAGDIIHVLPSVAGGR